MPKKYREVRSALDRAGWKVLRQRGSHEIWGKDDDRARIVVAGKNSDTVPAGTPLEHQAGEWLGASAMSEYVVIFERAEDGGWGAYLPDLPGVVALGTTRDEVSERIREAVDAYAQEMEAVGQPLPDPVAAAGTIQAA